MQQMQKTVENNQNYDFDGGIKSYHCDGMLFAFIL